jgi:DNA-3-methyladenine glycosylase II/AraC family transcriptional regulator of adaptative response / DNA-3-methyladenine glycosylase II
MAGPAPSHDVRLPVAAPVTWAPALRALAAHSVPGLAETDLAAGRHTQTVRTPAGSARVTVTLVDGAPDVPCSVTLPDGADLEDVLARVGRWLDLEHDPEPVDAHLAADPLLAPLVAARPGLRVVGSTDGWETAVTTVLGQQVSVAAARTFARRLVAAVGAAAGPSATDPGPASDSPAGPPPTDPGPASDSPAVTPPTDSAPASDSPAVTPRFPSAEAVAAVDPTVLGPAVGLTSARARTVHALATAVAGGLALGPGTDPAAVRARLLALPGIGPWTVEYLALRALGDRDACPSSDLVLRRALGGLTPRAVEAASQRWRPWRAYAVTHLWTQAAYAG